jgi:hypothetical protein
MRAKKAKRDEADAIRKKIEEQEAKNAHALEELSKKLKGTKLHFISPTAERRHV